MTGIFFVPVIVVVFFGLVFPFYKILYYHQISELMVVITVWIKNTEWGFLSAIGTTAAVFYAIFQNAINKWLSRPKLDVLIEKKQPYFFNIPQSTNKIKVFRKVIDVTNTPNGNAVYLSLKVQNSGKSVANNVSVLVQEMRYKDFTGKYISRQIDMHLTMGNIGFNYSQFPNIQSKNGVYWNFGMIANPKYRKNYKEYFYCEKWENKYKESEPALVMFLTYRLALGNHIIGPGNYEVDILVTCDQLKAIKKTILIDTSRLTKWPEELSGEDVVRENIENEENELLEKIVFDVKDNYKSHYNKPLKYYIRQIRRFILSLNQHSEEINKNRMDTFVK
jgi:hypothetical protein